MSRKRSEVDQATPENGQETAVAEAPKRKKRNPDAPRPMYFLLAVSRSTSLARIIGEAPTIGQARKQSKNAAYSVRDGEDGPFIARAKLVV